MPAANYTDYNVLCTIIAIAVVVHTNITIFVVTYFIMLAIVIIICNVEVISEATVTV